MIFLIFLDNITSIMPRKGFNEDKIRKILYEELRDDSEEKIVCDEDSKEEDKLVSNSSSSSFEEDSDEYDNDDEYVTSGDGTKWKKPLLSPPGELYNKILNV